MKTEEDPELLELMSLQDSALAAPATGTADDEDDPNDERPDENEAPIRETSDRTETPEELELDDEDE